MKAPKKVYKNLVRTASRFLSPGFRDYFVRKAQDDYLKFNSSIQGSKDGGLSHPSIAERYISEQKDLNEALLRVVDIYNRYYDPHSIL